MQKNSTMHQRRLSQQVRKDDRREAKASPRWCLANVVGQESIEIVDSEIAVLRPDGFPNPSSFSVKDAISRKGATCAGDYPDGVAERQKARNFFKEVAIPK
jgi:hypothetical protein